MAQSADEAALLYGTSEEVPAAPVLRAGPLEAMLDAGNLRYIKVGGREAIRAVAFIVRDRNWGTYNPRIENLRVDQGTDRFTVSYTAVAQDDAQGFRYQARIEGRADGTLVFEGRGEALSDFTTNRTGFVVLHPLAGVVGAPVTVEQVDGQVVHSRFPSEVDPMCPFMGIRALTHEVADGLKVTCRMEGDTFEMEDHRNWMDASYKTYVRPLAMPWPYAIAKGTRLEQRVTLTFHGNLRGAGGTAAGGGVTVRLGDAGRAVPRLGLAVPAQSVAQALAGAALLKAAKPGFLVCHFDAREGHDASTMQAYAKLGKAVGAPLVLEAVVPCQDAAGGPSGDTAIMKRDIAVIAKAAEGVNFERVVASPASDLKCTLPGSIWPPAPSWASLLEAVRAAFSGIPTGGGMLSYFTELNRKRPPAELLDFVVHTGCPLVHAGDDLSMTETLEALPSQFASTRAFCAGIPYWVFPTAVSMRANPYGAVPAENPGNIRQAMNRVDPRDRALMGAAWYAGYLARAFAAGGPDAITLAAVAGPSGILHGDEPWAKPGLDGAKVRASYHVLKGAFALADAVLHEVTSSAPREVQAFAAKGAAGLQLWLVNLTAAPQKISLEGLPEAGELRLLDLGTVAGLGRQPDGWQGAGRKVALGQLELGPYAIAAISA